MHDVQQSSDEFIHYLEKCGIGAMLNEFQNGREGESIYCDESRWYRDHAEAVDGQVVYEAIGRTNAIQFLKVETMIDI